MWHNSQTHNSSGQTRSARFSFMLGSYILIQLELPSIVGIQRSPHNHRRDHDKIWVIWQLRLYRWYFRTSTHFHKFCGSASHDGQPKTRPLRRFMYLVYFDIVVFGWNCFCRNILRGLVSDIKEAFSMKSCIECNVLKWARYLMSAFDQRMVNLSWFQAITVSKFTSSRTRGERCAIFLKCVLSVS